MVGSWSSKPKSPAKKLQSNMTRIRTVSYYLNKKQFLTVQKAFTKLLTPRTSFRAEFICNVKKFQKFLNYCIKIFSENHCDAKILIVDIIYDVSKVVVSDNNITLEIKLFSDKNAAIEEESDDEEDMEVTDHDDDDDPIASTSGLKIEFHENTVLRFPSHTEDDNNPAFGKRSYKFASGDAPRLVPAFKKLKTLPAKLTAAPSDSDGIDFCKLKHTIWSCLTHDEDETEGAYGPLQVFPTTLQVLYMRLLKAVPPHVAKQLSSHTVLMALLELAPTHNITLVQVGDDPKEEEDFEIFGNF